MDMSIPVVHFIRPDGARRAGELRVPASEVLSRRLQEMAALGIEITMEVMDLRTVNVCFDDGDFDFRFELIPNDVELPGAVAAMVAEFDANKFNVARLAFEDSERM